MTPKDFLELLWQQKPQELHVLIWTKAEKRSKWFRDIATAAEWVEKHRGRDIYVGVGLADKDLGPKRRCTSDEVAGIAGVWADFDIRSEAHDKPLPETVEAALSTVPDLFPPSIVIATGNGAHAWWLFKEPWIFESDEERKDAATLVARFQRVIQLHSRTRGWDFDCLADLARVLRIPGTVNAKDPVQVKPVNLHLSTERRYNPSEFSEYLEAMKISDSMVSEAACQDWKQKFADKALAIDLNARIDDERLQRWMQKDERFKLTWFRQRADLTDQSQSGYDLALAHFGVCEGLDEQEILNLMLHHRFQHKQRQRTRLDYFQRTITKASKCNEDRTNVAALPVSGVSADFKPVSADAAYIQKAQICERLSDLLTIRIHRIVKIAGREPIYVMEIEGGRIQFPSIGKLAKQEYVRNRIASAVNRFFPRQKPGAWEKIAQMFLDALVEVDGGEEMHLEGTARLHLTRYLSEVGYIETIDGQTAQDARKPLVREGTITVCVSHFRDYLNRAAGQNLSQHDVVGFLVAVGAECQRVHSRKFDQSRWFLPPTQFDPGVYSLRFSEEFDECRLN